MDPFSSISNIGGGAGAIGNQFGGSPQTAGPQSPKAILQALLAKLGMAQQGGENGGGQSGCSCGCAQRSNGLGF